jgi:membrane dipeptidase
MDHICQLAGNARHIAIGSDLDGGFGTEQSPSDLNTIADLRKLEPILQARGYSAPDIENVFYGNWARLFQSAWQHR